MQTHDFYKINRRDLMDLLEDSNNLVRIFKKNRQFDNNWMIFEIYLIKENPKYKIPKHINLFYKGVNMSFNFNSFDELWDYLMIESDPHHQFASATLSDPVV